MTMPLVPYRPKTEIAALLCIPLLVLVWSGIGPYNRALAQGVAKDQESA